MPTQLELRSTWLIDVSLYGILAYQLWRRRQPPMPTRITTSNMEVELCFQRKITLIRLESAMLPFNMTLAKLRNPFQIDENGVLYDCNLIGYTIDTLTFSVSVDGAYNEVTITDSPHETGSLVMKAPALITQNIMTSNSSNLDIVDKLTNFMLLYNISTSGDLSTNQLALNALPILVGQMVNSVHV